MEPQNNLFGLPDYIAQPKREYNGEFAPNCDHEPQANVKKHLESGLSITVLQCIRLYGSTELRRIVCRLRKSGMTISDKWYVDNGRKKYKVYFLSK